MRRTLSVVLLLAGLATSTARDLTVEGEEVKLSSLGANGAKNPTGAKRSEDTGIKDMEAGKTKVGPPKTLDNGMEVLSIEDVTGVDSGVRTYKDINIAGALRAEGERRSGELGGVGDQEMEVEPTSGFLSGRGQADAWLFGGRGRDHDNQETKSRLSSRLIAEVDRWTFGAVSLLRKLDSACRGEEDWNPSDLDPRLRGLDRGTKGFVGHGADFRKERGLGSHELEEDEGAEFENQERRA